MTDYGVGASGFARRPLASILEQIAARQRADVDPSLDTSPDTLVGKYNAMFGTALDELWAVAEAIYSSGDRGKAEGEALDAIGDLTGTPRRAATRSTVTATLTLAGGTLVEKGSVASVAGNPAVRFRTIADFTAGDAAGDFDVEMEAETPGPVVALAGSLSIIETSVSGWTGIVNASDAVPGRPPETSAEYRLRQVQELASPGGGTVTGIKADLLRVAGVRAAEVLENVTARTSADGIPSHAFEAIVFGGDNNDVAQSIWKNKPDGIPTHGSTTVTITDSGGNAQDVKFTRPTERQIYVAVRYSGAPGLSAALKAALVAVTTTPSRADGTPELGYLTIASDVYASRLLCAVLDVEGVVDAVVGVSFSSIADAEDGAASLAIGTREIATLDTSRIAVSEA